MTRNFADADVAGAHFAQGQVHIRKHGVEQLLAERLTFDTTVLQTPHDKSDDEGKRIEPAVNRVGNAMIAEKSRIPCHLDCVAIEHFTGLELALSSQAQHIFQPTLFPAFHSPFILLR